MALGVFRGKSQLAVHSGTGGTLRRWVRKGASKWHVPKEAFGLAFGTSVVLRRFLKDVPTELRRGHPAGLRDGSEGFIGRVLREYVSFSERLRKALSGWHVPKGFSKGSSGRVSSKGVPERVFERLRRGLPEGFRGGRLWSLDSKWAVEIHRLDRTDRNARDDEGRWIKDLRPGLVGQFRPAERTGRSWPSDRRSTAACVGSLPSSGSIGEG